MDICYFIDYYICQNIGELACLSISRLNKVLCKNIYIYTYICACSRVCVCARVCALVACVRLHMHALTLHQVASILDDYLILIEILLLFYLSRCILLKTQV
jgi:hypothetical protein